jgi:hypothetical protein
MLFFSFLVFTANACATYQSNNPAFYCDNIVVWPVASDIQNNAWNLSKQAYVMYYNLKNKYLDPNQTNPPSLNCLAVAQQMYCAYMFPYCLDDVNQPHRGVCANYCGIWANRCPYEDYATFCTNPPTTFCSDSPYLLISMFIFTLLLI